MASTDGGSVATGNETGTNFWDKLGGAFITGVNKYIDVELTSDSKNMPDQNDLVHGYKTNKNVAGYNTGIQPQTLFIGGALLLIAVVVIKKVL